MIGMKKGEVRRIIVPAAQGYAVVHAGEPYLPQPRDDLDRNALNSILKNPNRDATILFDVRVNRIR
ncbi:hypothetical protein T492DRAFT_1059709 [Pavlovales sp. CCMP2436]|nr:hypothetical protein T492DRAFT_1059709 [Pavlovales sp. CCMP2436]